MRIPFSTLLAAAFSLTGCYAGADAEQVASAGATDGDGSADGDGDGGSGDDGADDGLPEEAEDEVAVSGLRRLSIVEYEQTVIDLLGLGTEDAGEILPSDTLAPFDNDYTLQTASEPLIKGLELLAGDLAEAVVASPELRSNLVPCTPSGAGDTDCFRSFLATFGRKALRRPLTEDELDRFGQLISYGTDVDDFWAAIDAALRLFLQHPEMIYRVEIGEPVDGVPGVFRLNAYEVATRLSYFLVGTTTPDWLLDAAEAGELDSQEQIAAAADQLLGDDRARDRIRRFHALWLSYEQLSREGMFGEMHEESGALVEKVIFEDRSPWTAMLTADETYVTPELAAHYGLPAPDGAAGWVSYGDSGRAGLLSHGSFLSVGAKFGDTSPTQRGLLVRTRLFCQEIPDPPPDLEVDIDEPPMGADPDACKIDQYYMWQEEQCSACHMQMDPIGFGLEQYDATGAFRTAQADRPECTIDGEGNFEGVGTFNGPAELADLAIESGLVEKCVAQQLYRFAIGRNELDQHDATLILRLVEEAGGEFEFFGFVRDYASSDAFRHRREEE
ncbi:MAG: DUF1592 domain-containing protein [Myxococcota bacterium]